MAKANMVRLGEVGPFVHKWARHFGMTHKDFVLTAVTKFIVDTQPNVAEVFKDRLPMTVELAEQIVEWDGRVR
jgi:spore coat protein CotF